MKTKITRLDVTTKILLIILIVVVSYFIIFLVSGPFFAPTNMMDMMNQVIGGRIEKSNFISLIIALIIGILISFYLFKNKEEKEDKFNIIKKALSEDEKKILDEIKKAKEITQDSLKFRLDWSKAKVSTILTNLDRKGIIQRERIGKTYKVYLQKTV